MWVSVSSFSHYLSHVAVLLYPAFVPYFTNKTKEKKTFKKWKKKYFGPDGEIEKCRHST